MIVLTNKLYIPSKLVERSDWDRFSYEWVEDVTEEEADDHGNLVFDMYGKAKLVHLPTERKITTYSRVHPGFSKSFIAFPRGNLSKIKPWLKPGKYIDLRSMPPFGFDLRIKKATKRNEKWPPQAKCIRQWLKKGYGTIQGATGSGKTVIGIGLAIRLGLKVLLLSGRRDAYTQWEKELRLHTNIDELEEAYKTKIVGEYNTKKPTVTYPFTIATVQSFIKNRGRKKIAALQDEFGLLMLDEAHELCTPEFSQPITLFNSAAIAALTATPERRDNRHYLLYDIAGPVVATNSTKQVNPVCYFHETGECAPAWLYAKKAYPPHFKWIQSLSHLAKCSNRYNLIEEWIYTDLADNRRIACYSERRPIVQELHKRFEAAGYSVGYVDGEVKNRDEIYSAFREGDIEILFAGKVMNALVNLPEMDSLHVLTPVNNRTSIMQIYGRARRYLKGKRTPIVRYYKDYGGQLSGAAKNNEKVCKAEGWKIVQVPIEQSASLTEWRPPGKR